MREIIARLKNEISGERIFSLVEEITTFHRIQASTGYRAAAEHVMQRMQRDGLEARILSYPADGKTWFFTSKMFKEWDCKGASLHLINPPTCLADFNSSNMSIIQRSHPCDYRDQPLDIVMLEPGVGEEAYTDVDLQGKLIFVRGPFQPYVEWAIKRKGAAGIITDFIREMKGVRTRSELYDTRNYTSFWWKHTEDEPKTFGFVLTPRQGDELARLCTNMKAAHAKDPGQDAFPKATCYVDSALYDGAIEVVEAFLPGETEEEVLLVAHLCHPRSSANDNASGVAASMEAMRALKDLVAGGQLPALRRGIRVVFVPEFTGTYAYLHGRQNALDTIRAGINLDMVGGRQTHGYGPIRICDLPHACPSFVIHLAALVLDEVKRDLPSNTRGNCIPMFNAEISDFESGSDHLILADPTVQIPAVMLGQWPDFGYHTSADTPEVVDPFILHKSATIAAGFLYTLAALTEEDVRLILNKGQERLVHTLTKQIHHAVEEKGEPADLADLIEHTRGFFKASNQTYAGFFAGEARDRVNRLVESSDEWIDAVSDSLWAQYVENHAAGYVHAPAIFPEEYQYIPVRTFTGPLIHLEDYALGSPEKMNAYKEFTEKFKGELAVGHTYEAFLQFYIDGRRSLWEASRQAELEAGDGSIEYAHEYVQLLKLLGLVKVHSEEFVPAVGAGGGV